MKIITNLEIGAMLIGGIIAAALVIPKSSPVYMEPALASAETLITYHDARGGTLKAVRTLCAMGAGMDGQIGAVTSEGVLSGERYFSDTARDFYAAYRRMRASMPRDGFDRLPPLEKWPTEGAAYCARYHIPFGKA